MESGTAMPTSPDLNGLPLWCEPNEEGRVRECEIVERPDEPDEIRYGRKQQEKSVDGKKSNE